MSLLSRICSFFGNQSGNVAMMFGLSSFGFVTIGGIALDYSTASNARSAIAAAADSAALAGATTRGSATAREAVARASFDTNLQRAGLDGTFTPVYRPIEEAGRIVGYSVGVSGEVRSRFGAFYGRSTVGIDLLSEARTGGGGPVDVALVLDTTASMEGARMTGLKSAVNRLLDDLAAADIPAGLVRMGVVPFAQYVNVGMSNRNAPWIDVPADYQMPTTCSMGYAQIGTTNCRSVYYPPYSCPADGQPRTCPGYTEPNVCDPVYSTTQTNICTGGYWMRWYGCVGARSYPLNIQDGNYGTRIPGLLNVWCGTPIQPLTTDLVSVRSTVNGLTAAGDTFLPTGLVWGWRMLSAQEPLGVGPNGGRTPSKVMIFITDGRNTRSVVGSQHDGFDAAASDVLTREACQNIAADTVTGTRIFTIAFEMDGLDAKTILQNCAAQTNGAFYDARDSTALSAALNTILINVIKVSLTR